MSLQDYLNLQNQMEGTVAQQIPQLYDETNDKAVYSKGVLEAGGNVLGVGALTGAIKKLKGSKSILDKLDLSPEELDGMADEMKAGDYQSVLAKLSKKAINKAGSKLQKAIQKARGIEENDGQAGDEATNTENLVEPKLQETSLDSLNKTPTRTATVSDEAAAGDEAIVGEGEILLPRAAPSIPQAESSMRIRVPKRLRAKGKERAKIQDEDGETGAPIKGEAADFDAVSGEQLQGTALQRIAPKMDDMFSDLSGTFKPVMTVRVLPQAEDPLPPKAVSNQQPAQANEPEPEAPKPTDAPKPVEPTQEEPAGQDGIKDALKSDEPATTTDADDLATAGLKAGSKVAGDGEEVINTLLKGSLVDDDNPIGLIITGILGIGSLIGGGLIHTHHEEFKKPPAGPIKGFATQIGAGF